MDATIRSCWRAQTISTDTWEPYSDDARPVQPGEGAGFLVWSKETGLVGYLKPANFNNNIPRAAHEKIASDLAYEVGVNVPPVVLHRRLAPPTHQPSQVAISLAPRSFVHWSEAFAADEASRGAALAGGSGILALDAWLANTDRHSPRNGLVALSPETNVWELFCIDFTMIMNFKNRWIGGEGEKFSPVDVPPFFAPHIDLARVRAAAERITGLPDATASEIVRRIPDDFWVGHSLRQRDRVIERLLWRKNNLLRCWEQWHQSTIRSTQ